MGEKGERKKRKANLNPDHGKEEKKEGGRGKRRGGRLFPTLNTRKRRGGRGERKEKEREGMKAS